MKKAFISLFCILFNLIVMGQTYHPLPTNNVIWIDKVGSAYTPGSYPCTHYQYTVSKDTIIGAYTYHKLKSKKYYSPACPNGNITHFNSVDTGYFRNDIGAKKVYYKPNANSPEQLMYDFDLQLNDLYPKTFLTDTTITLRVDSIDSIPAFGGFRKRFFLVDTNRIFYLPKGVIEGMGGSAGFLGVIKNETIRYKRILKKVCLNGVDYQGQACSLITNIQTQNNDIESQIKVYYKSQRNEIVLEANSRIKYVRLYSVTGRLLYERTEVQNANFSGLKKGIYFLQCIDQKGSEFKKKVMVY